MIHYNFHSCCLFTAAVATRLRVRCFFSRLRLRCKLLDVAGGRRTVTSYYLSCLSWLPLTGVMSFVTVNKNHQFSTLKETVTQQVVSVYSCLVMQDQWGLYLSYPQQTLNLRKIFYSLKVSYLCSENRKDLNNFFNVFYQNSSYLYSHYSYKRSL